MTQRSKDIGTATETAVVNYLRANGFPHAERRALHGSVDLGDITGTPGLVWEVKGGKAAETAGDKQILDWIEEAETERANAGAAFGILVTKRKGYGAERVHLWHAWMGAIPDPCGEGLVDVGQLGFPVRMFLGDASRMLRLWGYGEPL